MKKYLLLFTVLALGLANAHSAVTIKFSGSQVLDSNEVPLNDGGLVVLLANVGTPTTSGTNNFSSVLTAGSLNIGAYLNGGLYQVIGRGYVDEFLFEGQFSGVTSSLSLTSISYPNLNTGDQLAVAWFPTLVGSSSYGTEDFVLNAGVSYGLYTMFDTTTWEVPPDGTMLTDGYAVVPTGSKASFFTASAIPEPSTYAAFAGVIALGVVAYRKRRRA